MRRSYPARGRSTATTTEPKKASPSTPPVEREAKPIVPNIGQELRAVRFGFRYAKHGEFAGFVRMWVGPGGTIGVSIVKELTIDREPEGETIDWWEVAGKDSLSRGFWLVCRSAFFKALSTGEVTRPGPFNVLLDDQGNETS